MRTTQHSVTRHESKTLSITPDGFIKESGTHQVASVVWWAASGACVAVTTTLLTCSCAVLQVSNDHASYQPGLPAVHTHLLLASDVQVGQNTPIEGATRCQYSKVQSDAKDRSKKDTHAVAAHAVAARVIHPWIVHRVIAHWSIGH